MREVIIESIGYYITLFVKYGVGFGLEEEEGAESKHESDVGGAKVYGIDGSKLSNVFVSDKCRWYTDGHGSTSGVSFEETYYIH